MFGFLYSECGDTRNSRSEVFIAMAVVIPMTCNTGPQAALIDEAFTPRLRTAGAH